MHIKLSRLAVAVSLASLSLNALAQQQAASEDGVARKNIMPTLEVIRVVGDVAPVLLEQTGTVVLVGRQQIEQIQPLST